MSAAEVQTLWSHLKTAGLVTGETPPASAMAAPWFIRVMLGVAGWIGAVFLLLFVGFGLGFVTESAGASFVVGLAVCAAAGALFRAKPESDFATQFGLAVSLAGQGLVLFALAKMLNDMSAIALGMSLFQVVLFITVSNCVHRIWSAWTGACGIVFALTEWHLQVYAPGLLSVACAAVWLNEFQFTRYGTMLRAGGYGLVLALISVISLEVWTSSAWLWRSSIDRPATVYYLWIGAWISAGLSGLALIWTGWRLLIREAVETTSGATVYTLGVVGVIALVTLKAPGLAPAMLLLLLAYGHGNRVLFGLGIATLLSYLFFYYYSLEVTLLQKSMLIAATGLVLLAARFMLHLWWPAQQQQEDHYA